MMNALHINIHERSYSNETTPVALRDRLRRRVTFSFLSGWILLGIARRALGFHAARSLDGSATHDS
jgi:hypothetical protein